MTKELGCGLIAIGRSWGTTEKVPSETEAISFLQHAYDSGIRFFDTAPSYGLSEKRLGLFLDTLTPEQRAEVSVATKFGEHWNEAEGAPYADHSLEALKRSLDTSVELLGKIAILQLHKANAELLTNPDVMSAFDYARELGITKFGASASDSTTAEAAIAVALYTVIQLPYNAASPQFSQPIQDANTANKELIINRPFQMGNLTNVAQTDERRSRAVEAFRFILAEDFQGVVLTGTSSIDHLTDNIKSFQAAQDTI